MFTVREHPCRFVITTLPPSEVSYLRLLTFVGISFLNSTCFKSLRWLSCALGPNFSLFSQIVTTSTNLALCLLVFPSMRSRHRITSSFSLLLSHIFFLPETPCLNETPLPHFQAETGSQRASLLPAQPLNPRTEIFPGIPPRAPKEGVCRAGQSMKMHETRAGRGDNPAVGLGWMGGWAWAGTSCLEAGAWIRARREWGPRGEWGLRGTKRDRTLQSNSKFL